MYGYILPDKPNMFFKDYALYRAFYCGMCKSLGKNFGQISRLTVNYDMTFLSVLTHSFLEVLPKYKTAKCAPHPFKSRQIVQSSDLLNRLCALNVLLAYGKLTDDIADTKKLSSKLAKTNLKKAYKRAKNILPAVPDIIISHYERLRTLEQAKCSSLDRTADCFASMLKECIKVVTGESFTEDLGILMYNIGRFVYFVDALDDLDEDAKKHCFNPFIAAYGGYEDRKSFLDKNKSDIAFAINSSIASANMAYERLKLKEGKNLLDNILMLGLRRKADMALSADKKLKKEKF